MRPHLIDLFIDRRFDLCPRRFRVVFPPLCDPQHITQSCAHLSYLLTPLPGVLLRFHALGPLPLFPRSLHLLLASCKKVKHTLTLRLLRNPLAIIIYLVAFVVLGDSITGSVLPVIVFLAIWEGMRRFLNRNTTTTKPTDTRRVVIFSDCVMAIAITLVAAQLELPELKFGSGVDHAVTESAVEHLTLILLIYLVAFLNIGIHWMSHYHMFRSIKRSNTWLVVINFAFLLCITLLFLPTTASIEYPGLFTSRFYYIAQTITAFLLVLMWIYAVQKKRMLDEEADPARIRRTTARLVRNLLIFAGLALLTLIFSMQIDILAYFWIYLLVEFVAFAIRRTQRFFLHRKLPKPEKSSVAPLKK